MNLIKFNKLYQKFKNVKIKIIDNIINFMDI